MSDYKDHGVSIARVARPLVAFALGRGCAKWLGLLRSRMAVCGAFMRGWAHGTLYKKALSLQPEKTRAMRIRVRHNDAVLA